MLALNNIRGEYAFLTIQLLKFGSSRFFVDRKNRKIANQGKKEVIITATVADSFSNLDLVVEAFELAGADWVDGMGS